ncbi:MAG TPA: DNA translocase FtsK, partial [Anaerolineaceae bacterium]|nr:DNA translocase FtsK [Anaerolineaceae bacterium]
MPPIKTKTAPKNEKAKTPAGSATRVKPIPIENLNDPPSSSPGFTKKLTSFWWDLAGVFLLALGFVLLLGGFGFTHGILLDAILHQLAIWFGVGRLIIPVALLLGAWLLLSRERQAELDFKLGRVILVELGVLGVLGSLSAFARENILVVEGGESLGGSIGWGLAHPLVSLIGWVPAGILLAVLSLFLFLYGFNIFGRVETWARERANKHQLSPSELEIDLPTAAEPAAVERPVEAEPTMHSERKPKTQASLTREFKRQRLELVETPPVGKPLERSANLPPLSLLEDEKPVIANQATINTNAAIIEKTLQDFGIPAKVVGYRVGPSVTQYAVEPGYIEKGANEEERQKVRIAQISSLSKDLALALKAERLRIEAPVPGKSYVGIEIPNAVHTIVKLRPILESENFTRVNSPLAIPLGRDVSGQPLVSDLTTMPHLLIAGATNSGKSICIAAITTCLVMNNTPEDLRLVMIDPKMVELTRFNGLPHLLGPVETDVERIKKVLQWAVGEMEGRYKQLEA